MNIKGYVFSMALEKSGVYWLGGSNMLSRYDADRQQWTEYSVVNKKLEARGLFDLTLDNRGTLWIATFTAGLTYLDTRRDTVRIVAAPELREPVYAVTQMDSDHLLIGSLRNLYVMDLKAWYAHRKVVLKGFNHRNGFMGLEPGQQGFYKDSKGQIWLTGSSALSVIDPKKLDLSTDSPTHTYFTKLNERKLPFTQLAKDSVFALPYGVGDVRVVFEAVGENQPFHSQYSYFVEGITKDWTPWQEQPIAILTHLASGIYTIRVKSRTGDTESKSEVSALRFTVRVWPWQSPYFLYYVSLLLVAVAAAVGYGYWTNRKKQQQIEAAKQQAEIQATEVANAAHLEAKKAAEKVAKQEQMVQILEAQTAQAQMNPHFIFNVLNTLNGLVYRQETALAYGSITKLGHLMRSYLSASVSLDGSTESLERGMITLEEEIKLLQMYVDFEQLQYRDRFAFSIEVAPELSPDFYRIPPLMIQPFVENAIKHGVLGDTTQKGNVWLRFWLDTDEVVVCEIEDDGIGREAAKMRKAGAIQTYRSEGLNLVKRRVEILNQLGFQIDITTTDRPERGTLVVIRMNNSINDD